MKVLWETIIFYHQPIIFLLSWGATKSRFPQTKYVFNVSHLQHPSYVQGILQMWNVLSWPQEKMGGSTGGLMRQDKSRFFSSDLFDNIQLFDALKTKQPRQTLKRPQVIFRSRHLTLFFKLE